MTAMNVPTTKDIRIGKIYRCTYNFHVFDRIQIITERGYIAEHGNPLGLVDYRTLFVILACEKAYSVSNVSYYVLIKILTTDGLMGYAILDTRDFRQITSSGAAEGKR